MFDLGITENQELERQKQEKENEEEDENSELPLYNPAVSRKKILLNAHIIKGQGIGKQSILRLC